MPADAGKADPLPELKRLFRDMAADATTLIRQEAELFKAELSEKTDLLKVEFERSMQEAGREIEVAKTEVAEAAKQAGVGAGLFGGSGFIGIAAFGTFTVALVAGLATFMPLWLSTLLVTLLYGGIASVLFLAGRKKVQQVDVPLGDTANRLKGVATAARQRVQQISPVPEQTIATVKSAKRDLQRAWQQGDQSSDKHSDGKPGAAVGWTSNTDLNFRRWRPPSK
ncbi:MAG: phage holin family protein [Actinomycetota bacterium]|nr:phage holin family protein [Actinomycetota bacterium]